MAHLVQVLGNLIVEVPDDINEIPFFETSLPRELAIKIFMHLDALDLCRCCQVSKAWKSLAEDELLWNQICRHLDYEDSTATVEKSRWKEIVREQVLKERQLRQNWKMRHGEMSTLEYVTGGILCAANSWHHRLVAGYSNGHVRVWDDDDDCTFIPSNTALAINELAECGTVSNIINRVCVNGHLAAASYSQGNVDIWMMNNGKTTPFSTLTLNKHIASLLCSKTDPLVVLHAGDTVWMYDLESSTSDNKFSEIPVGCDVFHLHIVPTKKHRSSRRMLAIGLYDQVRIHLIGEDPNNMSVVHNTISQKVTSLDCNSLQIAVGIHSDDGCMVKLYDLHKLKEAATLLGNTLPVSVINLVDSPQNSIVTGSCDGKIRIYDTRLSDPVITLQGHAGSLKCVQMDDWKVISGGNEGMVIVWDQRMASKLWEQHNRHPVEYMAFKEHTMYTANIPVDKIPESDGFDSIYHRRYRGSLCCYDFSVDVVSHPDLPSNVLSNYDDPEGYNYNINLAVPYD
ncbi:hypothetical protein LSH36_489g01066 [Paralvinella palmiformis]|uniref:F-box domain-containing protein n=1 Tax=Paralvinella palmiformis TaxID=53620 RepID=A0AAD9J9U9_9ANNE|nr:hypothetical protein LSH36_489g01066 [Paralvinella palmiformis]